MKIKSIIMGIVLMGALTMTGCMSSTQDAMDDSNDTQIEEVERSKDYNKGYEWASNAVDAEMKINENDIAHVLYTMRYEKGIEINNMDEVVEGFVNRLYESAKFSINDCELSLSEARNQVMNSYKILPENQEYSIEEKTQAAAELLALEISKEQKMNIQVNSTVTDGQTIYFDVTKEGTNEVVATAFYDSVNGGYRYEMK